MKSHFVTEWLAAACYQTRQCTLFFAPASFLSFTLEAPLPADRPSQLEIST